MSAHQWSIHDLHVVLGAAAFEHHMAATWRNERAAWHDPIVRLRFPHLNSTQAIQARGKGRGKLFWHVLHNHETRGHPGQSRQDGFQRLGASSGGAERHNPLRGLDHRLRRR